MSERVLVVGGGPAGMSAAFWLHDLALPFRWVEATNAPGGTLRRVGNPIKNLLGVSERPGTVLAEDLARDCAARGLEATCRMPVMRVDRQGSLWQADLGDVGTWTGSAVLLCTGTRPRFIGLDAEASHLGQGVEISVTRNLDRYADRTCVVVGGGDAALEGALLLADVSPSVHVVHRSLDFRAQSRFVERALEADNVHVHPGRRVRRVDTRGETVVGAVLDDGTYIAADGVFVRIGVEPVVPAGLEEICAADGYVEVDARGRTRLAGIYAAGDAISRDHQSVSWALGSAGRAVRAIHDDLFSSH